MGVFSIIISSRMAATCLFHPLEVVKIRMQLSDTETSAVQVASNSIKNERILALYSGLSAGLVREALFTATRLAIFAGIVGVTSLMNQDQPAFLLRSLCCCTAAGCVSSIIWTPTEVLLVRMAADSSISPAERRNYKNMIDALVRIIKEEGFITLWRGVVPTVTLNLNVLIWSAKYYLLFHLIDTENCVVALQNLMILCKCILFLGLTMPIVLLPIDFIKTNYQNMQTIKGKSEYPGIIDAMKSIVHKRILCPLEGFYPILCPRITLLLYSVYYKNAF